jgi:hypothetical protein
MFDLALLLALPGSLVVMAFWAAGEWAWERWQEKKARVLN